MAYRLGIQAPYKFYMGNDQWYHIAHEQDGKQSAQCGEIIYRADGRIRVDQADLCFSCLVHYNAALFDADHEVNHNEAP